MKKYLIYCFALFSILFFIACEPNDELVIGREAAPVLVVVSVPTASFYELDKSGILDKNIGIDSIPIAGMQVKLIAVYPSTRTELATLQTDGNGQVSLVAAPTVPSQYELTGEHKGKSFTFVYR